MRFILAATIVAASAGFARCEEPYQLTGKAWGACVGTHMRYQYNPPELIADVLKEKCGKLQEQERLQFNEFISGQIGKTFTAELAFTLMVRDTVAPAILLPDLIQMYVSSMKQPPKQMPKTKSAPQPSPVPQLSR